MYGQNLKSYIFAKTEKYVQTNIKYDAEITVDSSFLNYKNVNKNIHIIPNGVDIDKFDKIKTVNDNKIFKIIWVGRLHPQKGLEYLIDAIEIIKDKLKNTEVHLIGSGELEKSLKEKSSKYKIDNIIKFRGKIYGDDLIKEYKSAHLFVLPSLYEGQPLTLLEAWAAKLPVLVTDVGGNKDFIQNNINGFIIPPKDKIVLAQSLLSIISNKKLKTIGNKGYKLVSEKYSWKETAKRTFQVYNNCIKN